MNRALTSNREWSDHFLPLHRVNYSLLVAGLVAAGYSADRYASLAPYCSSEYSVTECRKAGWVQVYINALALGIDLDTIPNIQDCDFIGNLTPEVSGTFASLTTALAGANNDLVFTAKQRGTSGNAITVNYVVAGNNTALTVVSNGNAITVNVATGAGGAATSTSTQVANAIRSNVNANNLVAVSNASGNTGAGIVTALAATNLTGGTN